MGRGLSRQSLASRIFVEFVEQADDLLTVAFQPIAVSKYGLDGYRRIKEAQRRAIESKRKAAIQQLVRAGYLRRIQRGKKAFIVLTEKGFVEALQHRIRTTSKRLPKGQLCYVAFDIPERISHMRQALRLLLRQSGFGKIQMSLYGTGRDVAAELRAFVEEREAQEFIHVFVGASVTNIPSTKN